MNICMLSQYLPRIGGIENIVSDLAQRLVQKGHNVCVVAPDYKEKRNKSKIPISETLNGVKLYRFKKTGGFPFGIDELKNMYRKVLEADKKEKFDILHAHFAKNEGLVGVFAARKLSIPLITTVHGSDIMPVWGGMCESSWSRFWVRQVLKRSFRLSTVSNFLKKEVEKHGVESNKVKVIHNWIEPEIFSCPVETKQEKEKDFEMLSARRLVKKNGVDLLLAALRNLEATSLKESYLLHVLSNGPEEENLRSMIKGKRYASQVRFHGSVEFSEYLRILHRVDVSVIPSRWEGFGMVILEAFASGSCVVATSVGGIPEIIEHEKTGILVKPEPKSIAEGILTLYENDELKKRMVVNGKKMVGEDGYFNYRRGVEEWLNYYESTINDFS